MSRYFLYRVFINNGSDYRRPGIALKSDHSPGHRAIRDHVLAFYEGYKMTSCMFLCSTDDVIVDGGDTELYGGLYGGYVFDDGNLFL